MHIKEADVIVAIARSKTPRAASALAGVEHAHIPLGFNVSERVADTLGDFLIRME
jgi:hypothetical protein